MTPFQWITLAQTIVMALAAAGVALLYRGFRTGRWVQGVDHYDTRIDQINQRLDKAGKEMSDLADEVQKLPDRFRAECASKEAFEILQAVNKERHADLRAEIHKETTLLWEEIRRLHGPKR